MKKNEFKKLIFEKYDDFVEMLLAITKTTQEKTYVLEILEQAAYQKLHETVTTNLINFKQGVTL